MPSPFDRCIMKLEELFFLVIHTSRDTSTVRFLHEYYYIPFSITSSVSSCSYR